MTKHTPLKVFTVSLFLFIALALFAAAVPAQSFAVSMGTSSSSGNPVQNFIQKVKLSFSNAAQRFYLLLPGDKPGELVLNQAVQATSQLQTEVMSADISADVQNNSQSVAGIKIHADGPIKLNQTDPTQQMQQDLHLTGTFSMQGTSMQTDANVKVTDQKIYLQLNEVPVVPYFNLADLKGKWLSLDTATASAAPVAWSETQKQEFQQATTDLVKKSQLSSAKKETKNDHGVYVVDVTVPKDAVLDYMDAIRKIQSESQTEVTDAQAARASLQSSLNDLSELKLTLWVDQSSFYIRHVEVPLVYTKPATQMPEELNKNNPLSSLSQFQTLQIAVVFDFDKFNEPVTFVEPTGAEDAKAALQGLLGVEPAGSIPLQTEDTGIREEGGILPPDFKPTELPNLTPQQKLQLQQFNQKSWGTK